MTMKHLFVNRKRRQMFPYPDSALPVSSG